MTKPKAPAPQAEDERLRTYNGMTVRARVLERGQPSKLFLDKGRWVRTLDTYRVRCVIEDLA